MLAYGLRNGFNLIVLFLQYGKQRVWDSTFAWGFRVSTEKIPDDAPPASHMQARGALQPGAQKNKIGSGTMYRGAESTFQVRVIS